MNDFAIYGKRETAFKLIATTAPKFILEVGTARNPANTFGDGGSTILWDRLAPRVISIDINPRSQTQARKLTKNVLYIVEDSASFLSRFVLDDDVLSVDFVYLDGMDFSQTDAKQAEASAKAHLVDVSLLWPRLKSGALLAIDDCHGTNEGKHQLAKDYLTCVGAEVILESYVTVWRKP